MSPSLIINMTTIASRQVHYIDETLESLSQSDGRDIPVNLLLGSADTSHVERYRGTCNIVPWDEDAQSRAIDRSPRYNCNLNAMRALKYGAIELCLCCEDDIHFHEDWLSRLMLTISEIPEREYVLNLCLALKEAPDKRYAVDTRRSLIGAHALFYPTKALRDRVADYIGLKLTRGTNDNFVGEYAKERHALYHTVPKLAYHIGQVSCFPPNPAAPSATSSPLDPRVTPR